MNLDIEKRGSIWHGQFHCMASPCEVLIETNDQRLAQQLIQQAQQEALRIEQKFSRYRDDNIIHAINHSHGKPVRVDKETARLLDFAEHCYQLSDGLFDITSGVLRKAWQFNGSDQLPDQQQIDALLHYIGWEKVSWQEPELILPENMEIDFGGIGKEYAVDKVLDLLVQQCSASVMINFGGDCHANKPQSNGKPWVTGIENPVKTGDAADVILLNQGALATSGDVYRFLTKDGIRYSHIINPKTGWPAVDAPRSVTVAARTCTEAGILSTLAMLQGQDAEAFLHSQQVKFWCYR